jgi:hypothetical protein
LDRVIRSEQESISTAPDIGQDCSLGFAAKENDSRSPLSEHTNSPSGEIDVLKPDLGDFRDATAGSVKKF